MRNVLSLNAQPPSPVRCGGRFLSMRQLWCLLGFCICFLPLWGSNLRLAQLQQLNPTQLQLDIAWDHSWHLPAGQAPGNHDAIWIFGKYRLPGGVWQALRFSPDSSVHQSLGPLLEVLAVSDSQGVLVRRRDPGVGAVASESITLELAVPQTPGQVDLSLMGIEMVYVLEEPYWLGDTQVFHHFRDKDTGDPYWVNSELSIDSSELSVGPEASLGGAIPAAYPKGHAGFYAMKYELSQGQYRDFLNLLTFAQQQARTVASPSAVSGTYALASSASNPQRNGLIVQVSGSAGQPARYACDADANGQGNQATDGENRACNFLNWADLLAYLDWCGLRPLSELEFEKACRGPEVPIAGEFAWGTAEAVDGNTILQDGTPEETVQEQATATAGLTSHGYLGPDGPLRVGFGANANSDRLQSGASYYGILDLSGNLWELCVGVDGPGLSFTGLHGNGSLDASGQADVIGWPVSSGGIYRGGALNSGIFGEFRDLAVSDRFYWDLHPDQRRNTSGGRGGRSWPTP